MTNTAENIHNLTNDIKYVTVTLAVYCFTWLEGFYDFFIEISPLIAHYKPLIQTLTSLTTFTAGFVYFAHRIKNEKKKTVIQDLEIEKLQLEIQKEKDV